MSVNTKHMRARLTVCERPELAIAVAIALYGVQSRQALAATVGPCAHFPCSRVSMADCSVLSSLVEVPVLLALTWVSLYLKKRLDWSSRDRSNIVALKGGKSEVV